MRKTNRALAVILAVVMLFGCCIFANAEGNLLAQNEVPVFSDMVADGHWAKEALEFNIKAQILNGYEDGTVRSDRNMTRAEMAAIINRAFGATVETSINFDDVKPENWFYSDVAKAYNMQSFMGTGPGKMDPNDPIRREDVFLAIARVLVLNGGDKAVLDKFADGNEVDSWALDAMATLIEKGYINGNNKNELNPRDPITRAEFSQFMYNIFKTYYHLEGKYNKVNAEGSVMLRGQDITLENATINGDLVLGDGVGVGDAHLTNLTIKGRLLCRGGEGYVYLKNVTVGEIVVVNDVNGTVNFYNYRDEAVFNGVMEYTPATYLKRAAVGGGGGGGTTYNTVTFVRDFYSNGILYPDVTTVVNNVAYNTTLSADKFPTNAYDANGRAFAGWYDADGKEYTSETKITKSVTLTPRWYENETLALNLVYSEGVTGNNTVSIPAISVNRSSTKMADAAKALLSKNTFAAGYDSVHFGPNGIFEQDINGYTPAENNYDVSMIKIGLLDLIEKNAFQDILVNGYTNADVDTASQGTVNIGNAYNSDPEVKKTIDYIVATATTDNVILIKEVDSATEKTVIDGESYENYDVAVLQFRNLLKDLTWNDVKDYAVLDFYENKLSGNDDVMESIFTRTKDAILADLNTAINDVYFGSTDEIVVAFTAEINPVRDMYHTMIQAIGDDAAVLEKFTSWANITRVFAADASSATGYAYLEGTSYSDVVVSGIDYINDAAGYADFAAADTAVNKWMLNMLEVFDKFVAAGYADEYKANGVSQLFDNYTVNMTVADFADAFNGTSTANGSVKTATVTQELPFVTVTWTLVATIAE